MKNTSEFSSITQLYHDMDKAWEKIAALYSFECNGCRDNCCQSLFFHHTYIEKDYFLSGFRQLDPQAREQILLNAQKYCEKTFDGPEDELYANGPLKVESKKIMCPVNQDGKCLLYPFRPMICRLHGLPHELNRPGYPPIKGNGCAAGNFDDQPYHTFDRTPFYMRMAGIEQAWRQTSNQTGKIKQTIAQMLLSPQE